MSQSSRPAHGRAVFVVLGETGVGKSTFIQYATGRELLVGSDLESCTQQVQLYQIPGYEVYLADTPGFGDTYRDDATILATIDEYLASCFAERVAVLGVLYLHSMLDARMKYGAMKNLRMFRKMVGEKNLHRCRLVTTKWSLQSTSVSEDREQELRTNKNFWKPLVDQGAQIVQFHDSMESALGIIQPLLDGTDMVLKLTQETQIQGKKLKDTAAGGLVIEDLEKEKQRHREDLAEIRKEYEEAMDRNQKEHSRMLKEEMAEMAAKLEKFEKEKEVLSKPPRKGPGFGSWVVRGVAAAVGSAAAILSEGALAPAALLFYRAVEDATE